MLRDAIDARARRTHETGKHQEISSLYLELASECFNKAATAEAGTAKAMRQMARAYFAEAVVLNPSLSDASSEEGVSS